MLESSIVLVLFLIKFHLNSLINALFEYTLTLTFRDLQIFLTRPHSPLLDILLQLIEYLMILSTVRHGRLMFEPLNGLLFQLAEHLLLLDVDHGELRGFSQG